MKYKQKLNYSIFFKIFFVFFLLFALTGCGKVKNENQVKKYIKDKYNIDVEILSVDGDENSKKYELKEKNRNVKFNCTSSMNKIIIDGSSFGTTEQTNDNYYKSLTKSIDKALLAISKKYNVKLEENYDGLIWLIKIEDEKIDFDKTLNIANEIMSAYDLKKEPTIGGMPAYIYINLNGETTENYYKYTLNGNKTTLGNATRDFMDKWNIPEQLENDVLNYVNSLYSGECYIVETSIRPGYIEYDGSNYLSYIIKNDTEKIKKEFRFNLDKYREDLENNTLKSMKEYEQEGTEYIYE